MTQQLLNESAYNELTEKTRCVVQFTASWCGPCKSLKPILEEMTTRYNVDYGIMDISENSEFARSKGVQSIPYVEIYSGGELKDTFVGLRNREQLNEILNTYFG